MIRIINFNSLKARLIFSALLMVIIILPIIGFTLSNAFEQQLISAIKNELSAYNYSILSVAEVDNNQLIMPEQLLENQFNVSQSGLYSLITQTINTKQNIANTQRILWRSKSLLGITTPANLSSPKLGDNSFAKLIIGQQKYFVFSFSASFTSNNKDFSITIHIIKDYSNFNSLLNQFQQQLMLWLSILMFVLLAVQGLWLNWTLKPLNLLKQELTLVERGELQELHHAYPLELAQVTKQLNLLLSTERKQRQRYRNALSDLAHSLKTPLAVIQTQSELSAESNAQLNLINKMIEHQLKRAQSAGESAWHIGINVQLVVKKLCHAMEKIYADKTLTFTLSIDDNAVFYGDETDLLEILGNVIDNACKAAKQQISITVQRSSRELLLVIADDGIGISADAISRILTRGIRADTYEKGHGIGLAIVRDLVISYQGKLQISSAKQLSGAEFCITFPQK